MFDSPVLTSGCGWFALPPVSVAVAKPVWISMELCTIGELMGRDPSGEIVPRKLSPKLQAVRPSGRLTE